MDYVAVLHELPDQWINLMQCQRELRTSFQIAADEVILVHSQLEGGRAGFIDHRGAELLRQSQDSLNATDAYLTQTTMDRFAKRAYVRPGLRGPP